MESGISRLPEHPKGPEALSAGCKTVESEVIVEVPSLLLQCRQRRGRGWSWLPRAGTRVGCIFVYSLRAIQGRAIQGQLVQCPRTRSSSDPLWNFGLRCFDLPGHVTTRKAQRGMQEGVAGQDSGHHNGCTLFASKMQAGQEGVDKVLCTRRTAVVGLLNQHRVSVTRLMIQPQVQEACTLDRFLYSRPFQLSLLKIAGEI